MPFALWVWLVPPEQVYGALPDVTRELLRLDAWQVRPRDGVLAVGFLAYQFPLTGLLAGPGLLRLWRSDWHRAVAWLLWGMVPFAFALRHHVPDQYVFFLPAYLPVAVGCGLGFDDLQQRLKAGYAARVALLVGALLLPVATYRLAAAGVARWDLWLMPVRQLAWRDPATFFLWPPKHAECGARQFAEAALGLVEQDALILAEAERLGVRAVATLDNDWRRVAEFDIYTTPA